MLISGKCVNFRTLKSINFVIFLMISMKKQDKQLQLLINVLPFYIKDETINLALNLIFYQFAKLPNKI